LDHTRVPFLAHIARYGTRVVISIGETNTTTTPGSQNVGIKQPQCVGCQTLGRIPSIFSTLKVWLVIIIFYPSCIHIPDRCWGIESLQQCTFNLLLPCHCSSTALHCTVLRFRGVFRSVPFRFVIAAPLVLLACKSLPPICRPASR